MSHELHGHRRERRRLIKRPENQNRACFMSVFREAKLIFGDAKAGRLFYAALLEQIKWSASSRYFSQCMQPSNLMFYLSKVNFKAMRFRPLSIRIESLLKNMKKEEDYKSIQNAIQDIPFR